MLVTTFNLKQQQWLRNMCTALQHSRQVHRTFKQPCQVCLQTVSVLLAHTLLQHDMEKADVQSLA
jgi:hypothetical protein